MNYKTSHNLRKARILLAQTQDEQALLNRQALHPEARKLIIKSIEGKLATMEALRTGRNPSVSRPLERGAEVR